MTKGKNEDLLQFLVLRFANDYYVNTDKSESLRLM